MSPVLSAKAVGLWHQYLDTLALEVMNCARIIYTNYLYLFLWVLYNNSIEGIIIGISGLLKELLVMLLLRTCFVSWGNFFA